MRFHAEFQKKPSAKKRQFSQNVTVFLQGTSCFFRYFLTKKRAKGEISCSISEVTARKKTTIFTKRNGFFEGYIVFLCVFLPKKGQKVRWQKFQEKAHGKKWQLSQNETDFIQGTSSCFSCFWPKKGEKVSFQTDFQIRASAKKTIFTKRNSFCERYIVFF